MDEILDFVLELYRMAREAPAAELPDRALQMLRTAVPFGSALWANARYAEQSLEIYSAHPFDEPPEMLDEFVEFNRTHPIAVAEVSKVRGSARSFYAPVLYSGRELAGFRDYTRRYGHDRHLLAADIAAPDARGNWLSLYRADGRDDFEDRERRLISLLIPHLSEAIAINRALLMRDELSTQPREVGLRALVAHDGRILHCGRVFFDLISAEWPQWAGVRLPKPLMAELTQRGAARIAGGATRICVRQLGDALLLNAQTVGSGGYSGVGESSHVPLDGRSIELLIEALQALCLAAFVCTGNGEVVALTGAARELVTNGGPLSLANGRLAASSAAEARAVNDAIELAGAARALGASASRTVIIGRGLGDTAPVVLDVVALRSGPRWRARAARVLLVARGSREAQGRKAAILCAAYALTSSETEIALSVAAGLPAERIAERRGVAVGTVRGQIKTVLAKVGVRRQVELVARIAQL